MDSPAEPSPPLPEGRIRPLVVLGDANPDLVLRGDVRPRFAQEEQALDGAEMVLGGSATIMAAGAARLGVPTRAVSRVGDDVFGRFVRDRLTERGVDVSGIGTSAEHGTGLSVILSEPADRSILTYLGAIGEVGAELLDPAALDPGTHVHVAALFLMPTLVAGLGGLFAELRRRGCTTSLDTNWDPSGRWHGVTEVLGHTDLFFPNVAELCAIAGEDDLDRAASALCDRGATVVVKLGAAGGSAWSPDGAVRQAPAEPVDVVDTTGAGDSFNAGYLAAWLRGLGEHDCLVAAVRAGSASCRGVGGTATQATWDELRLSPSAR